MRHIIFSSVISLLLFNCQDYKSKEYDTIVDLKRSSQDELHPGKKLMETNCYICHTPEATEGNRLAPPMIAVKRHYINESISKKEFTEDLLNWIKDPSLDKVKMKGAVRRFGVMPKTVYPEEMIRQIADYIYDNDIEKPD